MSAELTGDLLDRDLVEKHEALMRQYALGACHVCIALFGIKDGETYRARGYKSWKAFVLGDTGLSEVNATRYAQCGPLIKRLIASGKINLVRHPDMLRPIAGMLSWRKPETRERSVARQMSILCLSEDRARLTMVPLTEQLIAEVAREHNWEPRGRSYKKEEQGPKTGQQLRDEMREHIELAIGVIVDYRRTGFELAREIGITKLAGFEMLREILNDAKDSEEFPI